MIIRILFLLFLSNSVFGLEEIVNGPPEEIQSLDTAFNIDLNRSHKTFFSIGASIETPLAIKFNSNAEESQDVLNGVGFNNGVIFDVSFNQYVSLGIFLNFGVQYMTNSQLQSIYAEDLKWWRSSFLTYGSILKIYPTGNFWFLGIGGGGEYRSGGLIDADSSLNSTEIERVYNYSTGFVEFSIGGEISFNNEFYVNLHIVNQISFGNQQLSIATDEFVLPSNMNIILGLTVGIVLEG